MSRAFLGVSVVLHAFPCQLCAGSGTGSCTIGGSSSEPNSFISARVAGDLLVLWEDAVRAVAACGGVLPVRVCTWEL